MNDDIRTQLHNSIMRGELQLGIESDLAFNYARIHRWIDAIELAEAPVQPYGQEDQDDQAPEPDPDKDPAQ